MWSLINVSSNLHTTDVKLTGLSFSGLFLDPFLNSGVMFASFHSEGTIQTSKSYLENIISEDFNSGAKKFWLYIKSKCQESTGVSPLKSMDGFLKSDSTSKAEILNPQFKPVFTEEDLSNLPHKGESPYPNTDDIEVSEKGVLKLLQNLRQNKAPGPDLIPAYILKIGAKELSPILTKIFQWSLDAGQVSSDWKEAMVVPIFKKGDKHSKLLTNLTDFNHLQGPRTHHPQQCDETLRSPSHPN